MTNKKLTESNEFMNKEELNLSEEEEEEQQNVLYTFLIKRQNILEEQNRVECVVCHRKFIQERIDQHTQACKKSFAKQEERKKIAMKKAQLKEKTVQQSSNDHEAKQQKQQDSKAKWKEEHENFQELIKYNRKIKEVEKQGGDIRNIQAPASKVPSDYVFCEHCKRNFAPHVAERHLPRCKDIISKPKPPGQFTRQTQQEWTADKQNQKDFMMTQGDNTRKRTDDKTQTRWSDKKSKTGKIENDQKTKYFSNELSPKSQTNSINKKLELIPEFKRSFAAQEVDQQSENSGYQTSTTMQSKARNTNKKNPKLQKKDPLRTETTGDPFLKTQEQGLRALPNLKNGKYQNWTNVGFVDCITRATINSNTDCPHCGRKFIARAAERHIPICEIIMSKLAFKTRNNRSLPKNQKSSASGLPPTQFLQLQQITNQVNLLPLAVQQRQASQPINISQKKEIQDPNDTFILGSQVTKFCTFCGSKFSMGHKYCGGCGKKREQ